MSTTVSAEPTTDDPGGDVATLSMLRLYGVVRALRQMCTEAAATGTDQPGDLLDLIGQTYRTIRQLTIRTLDDAAAKEFRRLFAARVEPDASESRVVRQVDLLLAWFFEHAAQCAATALGGPSLPYPAEVLGRHSAMLASGRAAEEVVPTSRVIPVSRELFERLAAGAGHRPELEAGDGSASPLQSTGQYL